MLIILDPIDRLIGIYDFLAWSDCPDVLILHPGCAITEFGDALQTVGNHDDGHVPVFPELLEFFFTLAGKGQIA